jgi:hypothetical protein
MGLPPGDLHALPRPEALLDGAQYRVEIPSVEGPRCLEAVLEEAIRFDVRVHRVSQGSASLSHTDAELDEMARLGAAAPVEVSLFTGQTRPGARRRWHGRQPERHSRRPLGQEQVVACLDDARRAADHGFAPFSSPTSACSTRSRH